MRLPALDARPRPARARRRAARRAPAAARTARRVTCSKTKSWPLAPRTRLVRGTAMPCFCLGRCNQHGDELAGAQSAGIAFDREVHRDRLAAVGEARSRDSSAAGSCRCRSARDASAEPAIASKLKASTHSRAGSTIWKMTALGCAICPATGVPSAITPGDRRHQRFRVAPHLVERRAPLAQALQLEPGVFELGCAAIAPLGASCS